LLLGPERRFSTRPTFSPLWRLSIFVYISGSSNGPICGAVLENVKYKFSSRVECGHFRREEKFSLALDLGPRCKNPSTVLKSASKEVCSAWMMEWFEETRFRSADSNCSYSSYSFLQSTQLEVGVRGLVPECSTNEIARRRHGKAPF